ncbi:hypothetical protein [Sphingobium aromaticiconvertens]|uniref:hypothetical protein n=1 Tax=Sphingobium aromaticiconvertens TaxID=365341 RepID=UPI00301B05F0
MIHPSAAQIIRTIEATLVDVVEPAVQTTTARSALATIGHLLRHVALRIEQEGQILADDILVQRALLADIATYLATAGDADPGDAIQAALAQAAAPDARYPSLSIMGARASLLRQAIQDALIFLQDQRDPRKADPAYQAIRAAIRTYLAAEVQAEGTLIHPAFEDKGPRR